MQYFLPLLLVFFCTRENMTCIMIKLSFAIIMHQLYKIMHAFAGFICIKPNSHLVFNFIGMQAEGIFLKKKQLLSSTCFLF